MPLTMTVQSSRPGHEHYYVKHEGNIIATIYNTPSGTGGTWRWFMHLVGVPHALGQEHSLEDAKAKVRGHFDAWVASRG